MPSSGAGDTDPEKPRKASSGSLDYLCPLMTDPENKVRLVDLQAQYETLKPDVDAAMAAVVGQAAFIGGKEVRAFGDEFADYCGAGYCVPCANGTDALEIVLKALGIGPGDEVIVPAFTFVATLEAVCNVGATPRICDVDPVHYTIDPDDVARLLTPHTRAVMPVHLYGQPADMDALARVIGNRQVHIVEDAAQAHAAAWRGQRTGTLGVAGCFSFYPGKNLGAYGDAGAIVTLDETLADRMRQAADHGRQSKYAHSFIGRNSRMDALQAAVLRVKLRHLDAWTESRRRLARRYTENLSHIPGLVCPSEREHAYHVYHLYVIRVPADRRDALREHLKAAGIETGIHYPIALNRLEATTGELAMEVSCPVAEAASREVLSLPLFPEMTVEQQDRVCRAIEQFFFLA